MTKLPFLSNSQLAEVKERALLSGIKLEQCPTCLSLPDDEGDRVSLGYLLDSKRHECNCQEQTRLRNIYLAANIPDQYQRLGWDDYEGDQEAKQRAEEYVSNWQSFKMHGLGYGFLSKKQGNGKSMLSLLVAKELIKQGEEVYFLPFVQMLRAFRYNDSKIIDRLCKTNFVVLDDLVAPPHDSLEGPFSDNFEYVVRERTNFNGTTFLSSNLTQSDLWFSYKRVLSVLEPKIIFIEVQGDDSRQSWVAQRTLSMALNHELKPIV